MSGPTARPARFAIAYTRPMRLLLTALGMGPGVSGVLVDADVVEVRMGWAFRARIPLASVHDLRRPHLPVLSRGVHGWAGRWLVNGSSRGVLRMTVEPPADARVCGVPVRLTELAISLENPDGLLAALGQESPRP
jgi:hypothetical protein